MQRSPRPMAFRRKTFPRLKASLLKVGSSKRSPAGGSRITKEIGRKSDGPRPVIPSKCEGSQKDSPFSRNNTGVPCAFVSLREIPVSLRSIRATHYTLPGLRKSDTRGSRTQGRPAGRPYTSFAYFAFFTAKFSSSERPSQYRLCQMISIPFAPLLVVVVPTFQSGAISYSNDTSLPCSPESCCEAET